MSSSLIQIRDWVYSWSVYSEKLKMNLNSHLLKTRDGCLLVDPIFVDESLLEEIFKIGKPDGIAILNENHFRDSKLFQERFAIPIWTSKEGESKFSGKVDHFFQEETELPGGFLPIFLHEPTKSEILLFGYRTLIFGDAMYNDMSKKQISFLPEEFVGDPIALKQSIQEVLIYQFETILFGHGESVTEDSLIKLYQALES